MGETFDLQIVRRLIGVSCRNRFDISLDTVCVSSSCASSFFSCRPQLSRRNHTVKADQRFKEHSSNVSPSTDRDVTHLCQNTFWVVFHRLALSRVFIQFLRLLLICVVRPPFFSPSLGSSRPDDGRLPQSIGRFRTGLMVQCLSVTRFRSTRNCTVDHEANIFSPINSSTFLFASWQPFC